jgi:hypothetical protein
VLGLVGAEQIDDERTDLVGFSHRRRISKSSHANPRQSRGRKSVEALLLPRDLYRYEGDIATKIDLGPAFGC